MNKHKGKKELRLRPVIKNRKTLVALVIVVIFLVWLAFVLIKDVVRHRRVVSVVNEARTALEQAGFKDLENTSGCGNTGAKFGKGDRVCSQRLVFSIEALETKVVDKVLSDAATAIENTKGLTNKGASFFSIVNPDEQSSESVSYTAIGVDDFCHLGYVYYPQGNKGKLDVKFSCVDTPWLARTFQTGQL